MADQKIKYWRERPPGAEQLELERMFCDNEIDYFTPIEEVQKRNSIFMKFSDKTFSAHFRKTRAALGLCAAAPSVKENAQIPEISGFVSGSPSGTNKKDDVFVYATSGVTSVNFENPPYTVWMYTDHKKKTDFVCVLLPTFSGMQDVNFDLSEDGQTVTVNYTWPSQLYKASELFKVSIDKGEILAEHPKIHSFVSNMIELGITEKSKPRGKITIQLPCRVKREIDSWVKQALKVNETRMVFLEFTAYQKALLVNDVDTSILFD